MCGAIAAVLGWLWEALVAVASWSVHSLPGFLQFAVSLATLLALIVAYRQLVLSQNALGGRSFQFNAFAQKDADSEEDGGVVYEYCVVEVRLTGPGVLHNVHVHLEVDGKKFDPRRESDPALNKGSSTPQVRHTMTSTDDAIWWVFWLPLDLIPRTKCVLSWVETVGAAIRTAAIRQDLTTTDVEQWRWYIGHKRRRHFRRWASKHGPQWFRRYAGKPRPLGKYVKAKTDDIRDNEGPFEQP
ncbi:hypothetical protein K6T84_23365 [Mycolicibacter sp. MYC101]|nr:hypothetical protein [Mycolicibacter sp. MYC101]